MERQAQIGLAHAFRRLHDRRQVLLLANAWDAGSARLLSQRGFAAIATTSAGVAWSLGYADGERAPLSVSVGGAVFRGDVRYEDLFHVADQQLYRAKQAGRNKVVVARMRNQLAA